MRILVDADACPVKDSIIEIAGQQNVPVILVSSLDHFSREAHPEFVQTIYVEKGPDASDFKIVQISQAEDIVVTQDYGLASLVLNKVAHVIHHTGFEYNKDTIDQLLLTRYISAQTRQKGGRVKGPSPLSKADKDKFKALLESLVTSSPS